MGRPRKRGRPKGSRARARVHTVKQPKSFGLLTEYYAQRVNEIQCHIYKQTGIRPNQQKVIEMAIDAYLPMIDPDQEVFDSQLGREVLKVVKENRALFERLVKEAGK